jgi:hypothetical protein
MIGGATLMQASVIETISINLSPINAGSILSGSVTLPGPIPLDGTVSVPLTFNDPLDYSSAALSTTLSVDLGTIGDTVRFSEVTFTNLANNSTVNLMVDAPAQCATSSSNPSGVPCQATGLWQDKDPAAYTGQYFITAISIPEPNSGLLVAFLMVSLALGRCFLRTNSAKR